MLKKVSMLALLCAVTVGSAYSSRGSSAQEREEQRIPLFNNKLIEDSTIFSPDSDYCANDILNNLTNFHEIIGFASSLSIQEEILTRLKSTVTVDSLCSFEEEAKYKAVKKLLDAFPEFENSVTKRCTLDDFATAGKNFGGSDKGADELFTLYRNWKALGESLVLKPLEDDYIKKSKELLSNANNNRGKLISQHFSAKALKSQKEINLTLDNPFAETFEKFEDVSSTDKRISQAVSSIGNVNEFSSVDQIKNAITIFREEFIKAIDPFDFIKTDLIQYNQWAVNFGEKLVNYLNENHDNRYNRIKNLKRSLQAHKDKHAGLVSFLDQVLNKYLCGQGEVFVKATKEAQETYFANKHKMKLEQDNQRRQ